MSPSLPMVIIYDSVFNIRARYYNTRANIRTRLRSETFLMNIVYIDFIDKFYEIMLLGALKSCFRSWIMNTRIMEYEITIKLVAQMRLLLHD